MYSANYSTPIDNNSNFYNANELAALKTLRTFNFWLLIIIVIVGLGGNIFAAIAICTSSKLRRISSNHYLVALALSDSVFLFGLFMIWLEKLSLPTYHGSESACKLVLYLLNSSGCLSAWYVTVLTIERFIVVYYPLYRRSICSVGRTRRAIIALVPWPLLFNVWILFAGGLNEGICDICPEYYRLSLVLNGVDMAISFVIPVVVIILFNVAICIRLWTRDQRTFATRIPSSPKDCQRSAGNSRNVKKISTCVDTDLDESSDNVNLKTLKPGSTMTDSVAYQGEEMRKHTGGNAKMGNQERKITKTLLIVSFVYVALNMPSYSIRLHDSFMVAAGATSSGMSVLEKVIRNVFLMIYYWNFALNFIVYSLSSKNFRAAIKSLWCRKMNSPHSTSTGMSYYTSRSGGSVRNRLIPSHSPSPCPSNKSSPNLRYTVIGTKVHSTNSDTTLHPLPSGLTSSTNLLTLPNEAEREQRPLCGDIATNRPTSATLFVV